MTGPLTLLRRGIAAIPSLKVKLGAVVAVSVLTSAAVAWWGAKGGVPVWVVVPVTTVVALVVSQLVAQGMIAPLRDMNAATQAMALGDYHYPISPVGHDEVAQLAHSFTAMAGELARADQQRRDLIATISHELRTPVAALQSVAENLADQVIPADLPTLVRLSEQAHRLGQLVASLLDLTRWEAGVCGLELDRVPVGQLLASAVAEVPVRAGVPQAQVQVHPTDLSVRADEVRLRQVVTNLLENAYRHSPPGGVVLVSAQWQPGQPAWQLQVIDSGPGVDPAQREHIFQRFGTATPNTGAADLAGGTGLGLAIVRWIVGVHGGHIEVTHRPDGQPGACFDVDLPVEPDQRPRYAPAASQFAPTPVTNPAAPHRKDPAMTPPPPPSEPPTGAPVPAPAPLMPPQLPGLLPPKLLPSAGALAGLERLWPQPLHLRLPAAALVAALVAGVVVATTMPFARNGLGTVLGLGASGVAAWWFSRNRRDPWTLTLIGLASVLTVMVMLRASGWLATLCVLTACGLLLLALTGARTLSGMMLSGLAWPVSGLRGAACLTASAVGLRRGRLALRLAATLALCLALLVIFGALLASADALFREWVSVVIPNLNLGTLTWRVFVGVAASVAVVWAIYLGVNPPQVDLPAQSLPQSRARHSWEVYAPLAVVSLLFVVFLLAQATALFGGHDYLQRTTGLTYAQYTHQGFGQLVVVTLLTLMVVGFAVYRSSDLAAGSLVARLVISLPCVLVLLVVASALHRITVYQQAFGFTVLRLLVIVFEAWLGVVLLAVSARVNGLLSARWLPRVAVLTAAVTMLGVALLNPDAWIASHNIKRYQATGTIDWYYLSHSSDDAIPAVETLPQPQRQCALTMIATYRNITFALRGESVAQGDHSLLAWNASRRRAETILGPISPAESISYETYGNAINDFASCDTQPPGLTVSAW